MPITESGIDTSQFLEASDGLVVMFGESQYSSVSLYPHINSHISWLTHLQRSTQFDRISDQHFLTTTTGLLGVGVFSFVQGSLREDIAVRYTHVLSELIATLTS